MQCPAIRVSFTVAFLLPPHSLTVLTLWLQLLKGEGATQDAGGVSSMHEGMHKTSLFHQVRAGNVLVLSCHEAVTAPDISLRTCPYPWNVTHLTVFARVGTGVAISPRCLVPLRAQPPDLVES